MGINLNHQRAPPDSHHHIPHMPAELWHDALGHERVCVRVRMCVWGGEGGAAEWAWGWGGCQCEAQGQSHVMLVMLLLNCSH